MRFATFLSIGLLFPMLSSAQSRRGGWDTFGGDPQRTSWNRGETELTKENVRNLKLEWSLKLNNVMRDPIGPQGSGRRNRAWRRRYGGK